MASVAQVNRHRISGGDACVILGVTENKMNGLVSVSCEQCRGQSLKIAHSVSYIFHVTT